MLPDLQGAWDRFRESILAAEDTLAKVYVYPATIPIYEARGLDLRAPNRHKMPVATLHFDGTHLKFAETKRPFPRSRPQRCPSCRTECPQCRARQTQARGRWDAVQEERAQLRDVLEIEDTEVLSAIVEALPIMRDRLIEDSRVTPEEIWAAVAEVEKFLELLRAHV
jgi:hypothetical protein